MSWRPLTDYMNDIQISQDHYLRMMVGGSCDFARSSVAGACYATLSRGASVRYAANVIGEDAPELAGLATMKISSRLGLINQEVTVARMTYCT